jgi:hypothetical protein
MTPKENTPQSQQPQNPNITEAFEQRAIVKALLGSGGDPGNPNQGFVAQAAPTSGQAPPDSIQAQAAAAAQTTSPATTTDSAS